MTTYLLNLAPLDTAGWLVPLSGCCYLKGDGLCVESDNDRSLWQAQYPIWVVSAEFIIAFGKKKMLLVAFLP